MASKSPRERLLAGAIDYVAEHGLADVSLRTLAEALGTSHRMLIHHFGSKEQLWVEIVRTVEARQASQRPLVETEVVQEQRDVALSGSLGRLEIGDASVAIAAAPLIVLVFALLLAGRF